MATLTQNVPTQNSFSPIKPTIDDSSDLRNVEECIPINKTQQHSTLTNTISHMENVDSVSSSLQMNGTTSPKPSPTSQVSLVLFLYRAM